MDVTYGNYFFTDFYAKDGGGDYTKREIWEPFFDSVAQNIIDKFNPTTVLDAGCAMGYLVEALRKKGVEAYGFDVSEYAIANVAEEVKPYCFVHSITEKLPDDIPKKFDLVITIEVMEHLFPQDGSRAISNLCQYSDTIIFTSTPDDIEDMTHLNVQQAEYWCKEFAKNSFFRDHLLPVDFICAHAMLFRRKTDFENVIFDYELYNRVQGVKVKSVADELTCENTRLKSEVEKLELQRNKSKTRIKDLKQNIKTAEKQYSEKEHEFELLNNGYNDLQNRYKGLSNQYDEIQNASWWKITKPFRMFTLGIRTMFGLIDEAKPDSEQHYDPKMGSFAINSSEELEKQRQIKFEKDVKFSVLVPIYNTPEDFLREMIESVKEQTYSNWELCLADGSDKDHRYVRKICRKYAGKDSRIKYKKLEKNLGISENTNECIRMATGDYIALFDHDDILNPSALFENAKVINEKGADFIYSDEAVFEGALPNIALIHFKPDFSIEQIRTNNYICHLTVFKKDLLDQVGMFREEFNGSQDYDMVLRLTEKAEKIVHIPKVLYYWRRHEGSVASDISSKPYAVEAGRRAVQSHLDRCNIKARAINAKYAATYKVEYEIEGSPLVSILIPNKDHVKDLSKCINSIFKETTYSNFEIIIIENNSEKEATFEYYDSLKEMPTIKVVEWKGKFNYSAINNFGAGFAEGEHLVFLNNDVEVITENWIEEMLMHSQREGIGAVGAKLYYPDDTIQHAGIVLGLRGVAAHAYLHYQRDYHGYMARLAIAQNLSAVTAACMMMPKAVFDEIGGFDESFEIAYNDVDLCMKVRKQGYFIVWTPYAELYHHESKSRGDEDTPKKLKRFNDEAKRFKKRWAKELKAGDPYYNPNLTLKYADFSIK